jgi:hypothetical protein
VHPAVERHDLVGHVAVAQDGEREVGDLLRAAEAPDGDHRGQRAGVPGQHRGVLDQRGRDGVDGHALAGGAAREVVRQAVEAGLRGSVVRAHDPAGEAGDRRHEEHAPEAALDHPRHRAAREEERRAQVDREHLVERRRVDLLQARDLAAAVVGDQDVDVPEDGLDLVDEAVGRLRVAEVRPERRRLRQRRRQPMGRLGVGGVVQRQRRAGGGQPLGEPAPDPAAGAGDERRSALEGRHGWVAHCMMSNARAPRGPAS